MARAGEPFLSRNDLRCERHPLCGRTTVPWAAVRLLSTNTAAVTVRACVRVYAHKAESDSSPVISLIQLLASGARRGSVPFTGDENKHSPRDSIKQQSGILLAFGPPPGWSCRLEKSFGYREVPRSPAAAAAGQLPPPRSAARAPAPGPPGLPAAPPAGRTAW